MNKIIKIICCVSIVSILIVICNFVSNWPSLYKSEFDKFFGSDWTYVRLDDKYDDNLSYTMHTSNRIHSYKVGGKVKYWEVYCNGESYYINNGTFKYNRKKYIPILSKKSLSTKQAIWYEFLEIAEEEASSKLVEIYAQDLSNDEYSGVIGMRITTVGQPDRKFLKYLSNCDWLNINISPFDLLTCKEHEFEVSVNIDNYQFKKLSNQQQKVVESWIHNISDRLLEDLGEYATFSVYFNPYDNDPYKVEYENGILQ